MQAPKVRVIRWAISSPLVRRRINRRARLGGSTRPMAVVAPLILVYERDRLEFLGLHRFGELGVGERFYRALAASDHPVQELLDGVAFGRILNLHWDQEPGEAGN